MVYDFSAIVFRACFWHMLNSHILSSSLHFTFPSSIVIVLAGGPMYLVSLRFMAMLSFGGRKNVPHSLGGSDIPSVYLALSNQRTRLRNLGLGILMECIYQVRVIFYSLVFLDGLIEFESRWAILLA